MRRSAASGQKIRTASDTVQATDQQICVVAAVQHSKIISKIQKAHAIFQLYLAIIAIKRP